MKYLSLVLAFSIFLGACTEGTKPAETVDYTQTIKSQAETMGQLLLKKDFKSFVKFTHPIVLQIMEGEQKLIENMESTFTAMEAQGTSFTKVSFGEPSKVISINKELQATIQQTIELKMIGGKMVAKSTLIAISTNEGKNWYFVDSDGLDNATMKKTLPSLSDELVLPKKEEPVVTKD